MFGEREIEEEKKMEQIKIHLWAVKALPLHLTSISIVMCYSFCECASGQICSYFHLCSNAVQSSGFLFSLYLFSTKNQKNKSGFFFLFLSLAWNFKIAPCWVMNLFVGHCQPDQARAMLHMLIGSGVKTSSFRRKHNLTSDSSKPIFCGSFPTLLLSCSNLCDGPNSDHILEISRFDKTSESTLESDYTRLQQSKLYRNEHVSIWHDKNMASHLFELGNLLPLHNRN